MTFVFTKKTAFMQRIADLVRNGHMRFVLGEIPRDKAAFLAEKFSQTYQTELSKLEQSRKRKRGVASARCLIWLPSDSAERVWWVLLVSNGQLPIEGDRENWMHADDRRQRIVVDGYELLRLTKPEEAKPVWTWRYSKDREDAWRESLIRVVRNHRDDELRQYIHNIWRSPGFAGVRQQVKKMGQLIRSEWRRSRVGEPLPEIPAHIGYVRRLADVGFPISKLNRNHAKLRIHPGVSIVCDRISPLPAINNSANFPRVWA